MNHTGLQSQSPGSATLQAFAGRAASAAWERLAFAAEPQNAVWAWFKPAHIPHGLILRIPDETYRDAPQLAEKWTLRKLLQLTGVDPAGVTMWYLYGAAYDAMQGTNPFLDAPIPRPAAGVDPHIVVYTNIVPALTVPPPAGVPQYVGAAAMLPMPGPISPTAAAAPPTLDAASMQEIFEHISADWHASLDIEKEMVRTRKQLVDMMGRLKALNRDLNPIERVHSNTEDKKDWLEARRWLREGSLRLWKCIKEHDIGDTSTAGQRAWFEQTYRQYVVTRKPFDGMQRAAREFENYRKMVQTLLGHMNTALTIASNDCERRAQAILTRIANKIREATNKKNFLGVIVD